MQYIEFLYTFMLGNDTKKDFLIQLDAQTLQIQNNTPASIPEWARLEFHQCSNCPYTHVKVEYCPIALNLVNIFRFCSDSLSYERVVVKVTAGDRVIIQETSIQNGVGSLMGIVIATSGCPHSLFFRPMARFHLPFASHEETIYRVVSNYLLAQYFKHKDSLAYDFELKGLHNIYDNMRKVNSSIVERLRNIVPTDSAVNAVVFLDNYATLFYYFMENSIDRIKYLFDPFLKK